MESNGKTGLMENAVVLELRFRKPSSHRKGDLDLVETPADKRKLSLGKKIWDCPEYIRLTGVASMFTGWLKTRELQSPFSAGMHLIPVGVLQEVYDRLDAAEAEYGDAADGFAAVVPSLVEADRTALADQFCEADYAPPAELRAACKVTRRLIDFSPPGASKVGQVLSEREAVKWRAQLQEATADVTAALREAARKVFGNLADRLGTKTDGKRSVLKAAGYEAVTEFLDLFDKRNIAGDTELAEVVAAARRVLDGKTVDDVRDDRAFFKGEADGIVAKLDTLVAAAPRRRIVLEEEAATR